MSSPRSFPAALRGRTARTGAVALMAAALGAGAVLGLDGLRDGDAAETAALVSTPSPTTPASLTFAQTDFGAIYADRSAGVVSILAASGSDTASQEREWPFRQPGGGGDSETPQTASQGSGIVIDTQGHILTNEHVVSGATTLKVTFSSGTTVDASVVGTDPSTDLAVIRVDVPADQLSPVPLGDSAELAIGDPALVIGNPFGFQGSASAGIISGLGRSIQSPNGFSVPDAIQTDAAINHGNSGGALLDAQGRLIGVPAQIADSGVNANVGVAFAIPVDTAKRVIEQLTTTGEVAHSWLGVSTASVDHTLQGVDGVGADRGALITGVASGGPAQEAGISPGDNLAETLAGPVCTGGDVITAVDGEQVATSQDLQTRVGTHAPGTEVALTVVDSAGERRQVTVTLAARPATAPQTITGCNG